MSGAAEVGMVALLGCGRIGAGSKRRLVLVKPPLRFLGERSAPAPRPFVPRLGPVEQRAHDGGAVCHLRRSARGERQHTAPDLVGRAMPIDEGALHRFQPSQSRTARPIVRFVTVTQPDQSASGAGEGQGQEDGPIGTGPVGGYAPSALWVSLPVSGGSKTLITWTSLSALTWCRSFGPTT